MKKIEKIQIRIVENKTSKDDIQNLYEGLMELSDKINELVEAHNQEVSQPEENTVSGGYTTKDVHVSEEYLNKTDYQNYPEISVTTNKEVENNTGASGAPGHAYDVVNTTNLNEQQGGGAQGLGGVENNTGEIEDFNKLYSEITPANCHLYTDKIRRYQRKYCGDNTEGWAGKKKTFGDFLRIGRIQEPYENLRDYCKSNGLDPVIVSHIENGEYMLRHEVEQLLSERKKTNYKRHGQTFAFGSDIKKILKPYHIEGEDYRTTLNRILSERSFSKEELEFIKGENESYIKQVGENMVVKPALEIRKKVDRLLSLEK